MLVAIAEGTHAREGISTISGDRAALLVAAGIGFAGTLAAWFGPRPARPASTTSPATRLDIATTTTTSTTITTDTHTPLRRTA